MMIDKLKAIFYIILLPIFLSFISCNSGHAQRNGYHMHDQHMRGNGMFSHENLDEEFITLNEDMNSLNISVKKILNEKNPEKRKELCDQHLNQMQTQLRKMQKMMGGVRTNINTNSHRYIGRMKGSMGQMESMMKNDFSICLADKD